MTKEHLIWIGAGLAATMFGVLVALGASGTAIAFWTVIDGELVWFAQSISVDLVILLAILGALLMTAIGWSMRTVADEKWLPTWVIIGFAAKLGGTLARFYMVTVVFERGDSFSYYRAGTELATQWRQGRIPELTGIGSLGRQVVEAITGGLFAIVTPGMLGGFIMFAMITYLGQLLLYAAFRRHAKPHQLKPYAILIFLLPTYSFWPSSIGKDAIVLLALGVCAYFAARIFEAFEIRWLFGLALALGALGVVRIHVAGLVAGALIVTTLIAKVPTRGDPVIALRRLIVLGSGLVAGLLVLAVFSDVFGIDITSTQDLDGLTADIVRRTSQTGTIGAGGFVTSPADIPGALSHVLFRPFLFEASEIQHYIAAIETTIFVGLTIWKLPAMGRNIRNWRSNPYIVFSTFYTIGFAVIFSVIRNIGIIARQRGQVLAFFLCVVIGLGWEEKPRVSPMSRVTPEQTSSAVD